MNNKVMLAVCMPAYNAEAHIAKAISSILAQTYKIFKFVITDDCSTDKTIDVINNFDDPRIILLRNTKNLGTITTRNSMIEYCKENSYTYMAVMDADDITFKDRLRKQVKILENDTSIAVCGSSMKVERNNSVWYAHQLPENIKVGCIFGNPIPTSTATFRLRHLEQYDLRWDNKYSPCADYHLWYLMLYKHNLRAANTGDVDMIYTHSPVGISHRNGLIAQERKDVEIKQLILECFSLQVSFDEIFSFMKVASYRSSEGKDASGYLNVSRQLKLNNKGQIVDSFALDRAISNRASIYLIKTQDIPDLVKKDILENLIIKRHFLINIIMNMIIKFKYKILDRHFPCLSYKATELYSKVRERH